MTRFLSHPETSYRSSRDGSSIITRQMGEKINISHDEALSEAKQLQFAA